MNAPFLWIPFPVSMSVDANRDGRIALNSEDDSDVTTAETPFRFWINDDDDTGPAAGNDIPGQASGTADYSNNVVDSVRDLVDFFPVYLDIKQLLTVLPPSASIKYKLKQADGALNFFYTNKTRTQALDYEKQILTTGFGPDFTQAAGVATTQQITAAGVELNAAFLDGIKNTDWGVVLIEGRAATTAPLVLSVEKDGTVIAEEKLEIKISPVEDMFRHVDLTGIATNYDGSAITPPKTNLPTSTGEPANWPNSQTNGKYFVLVHGFNVDGQAARGWNAEVFKRLHVLGSKARFVGVAWNGTPQSGIADTYLDYHKAAFNAFNTGDVLNNALSFTSGADVTVAGHSLGNLVVSNAIQHGGFVPSRYYMINAATPIEAYSLDDVGAAQPGNMTEASWRSYNDTQYNGTRLYAANWYKLFLGTSDNRRFLTWKERFIRAKEDIQSFNFYSGEEDVVANADGATTASIMATLLRQGFDVSTGAWKAQELVKGVDWTTSAVAAFMERGQAGWGFNIDDWHTTTNPPGPPGQGVPVLHRLEPSETTAITSEQLKTKPFFGHFLESDLTNANVTTASAKASETKVQYDLLARAIPAMSNAVAANNMGSFSDTRNYNMPGEAEPNGTLPTPGGAWRHSDFKVVALPYIYPVYEKMITLGGLK